MDTVGKPPNKDYNCETGDWGSLPNEPCRHCHKVGGVMFLIQDGWDKNLPQMVRCTLCHNVWEATTGVA